MKVIVYQSFRGPPPPAWLTACMKTAAAWAAHKGYDYEGDLDLFSFVPEWFREKAGSLLNVVADLARLQMARHFLAQGYERAIWLDADVVVFDPERYEVDLKPSFLMCRELWVDTTAEDVEVGQGPLVCNRQVTNSMTMFAAGNDFLDFYIDRTLAVVRESGRVGRLSVSTQFLTELAQTRELPLHSQLGMFSPVFKHGLVQGIDEILDVYAGAMESPVYAANLCFCHRGMRRKGILVNDDLFQQTVDVLLRNRGAEFNDRYVRRRSRSLPATAPVS